MKFRDKLRFVRQNMTKNKSRIFMTVLATAMGCAFLIVLASVGFGLHKSVIESITKGRLLTEISIYGKMGGDRYNQLTDEDIAQLEQIKNVKSVTRRQIVAQGLSYRWGEQGIQAHTQVVHLPSELKAGFELAVGRMPEADHEVIIGYHFAGKLLGKPVGGGNPEDVEQRRQAIEEANSELIDESIELTAGQIIDGEEQTWTVPVQVVGIAKAPTREWMIDSNVIISEPLLKEIESFTGTPRGAILHPEHANENAQTAIPTGRTYDSVNVYANDASNVSGVAKQLKQMNYANHSIANELEHINPLFLIMKIGLIFVGTIAIVIASIGIYNTMTMAVTERSQDIGIMKAIGAHPSTIRSVFLLESSYIGLLGAVIGTIVSYLISYIVNLSLPFVIENVLNERSPEGLQFSHIPPSLTLLCITISIGIAVLSGYRPAKRATQIDVLKALRRDI